MLDKETETKFRMMLLYVDDIKRFIGKRTNYFTLSFLYNQDNYFYRFVLSCQ